MPVGRIDIWSSPCPVATPLQPSAPKGMRRRRGRHGSLSASSPEGGSARWLVVAAMPACAPKCMTSIEAFTTHVRTSRLRLAGAPPHLNAQLVVSVTCRSTSLPPRARPPGSSSHRTLRSCPAPRASLPRPAEADRVHVARGARPPLCVWGLAGAPRPTPGVRDLPKQGASAGRGARDLCSVPMASCRFLVRRAVRPPPAETGRFRAAPCPRACSTPSALRIHLTRARRSYALPKQVVVAVRVALGFSSLPAALCFSRARLAWFPRPAEAGRRPLAGRAQHLLDAVAACVCLTLCTLPLVSAEAGHSCVVRCARFPLVAWRVVSDSHDVRALASRRSRSQSAVHVVLDLRSMSLHFMVALRGVLCSRALPKQIAFAVHGALGIRSVR